MESLTFDSSDVGLVEATVSKLYSKMHIDAVGYTDHAARRGTRAHEDITIADIAAAAFVSIRGLQLAFRRHLDSTPLAYLRRVRLAHAHRQLRLADPARETVTAVAYRWGFSNPQPVHRLLSPGLRNRAQPDPAQVTGNHHEFRSRGPDMARRGALAG